MNRVLVTGAAGFIGRHVLAELLESADWDVVATSWSGRDHRDVPAHDRLMWVHANLATCDPAKLARVTGEVQYVINLAASTDAAHSVDNPVATVQNNVALMALLLEYARLQPGLERFVQVSSAEVFGVSATPFTERSPICPLSPYAASKAAQDAVALAYRASYGLPVIVSHTANVFGEGQPAGKFLPAVVRRVLAGQPVDVAPGWRRFIHARDCAAAWVWLLRNAPSWWERCNVAGEVESDHAGFVQAILYAMRGHLPAEVTLRAMEGVRAGQDGTVVLDGSRLAAAGWRHPLGLRAGVGRAVAALLGEMEPV